MKVSDIIIDMATGDASMRDAYIQEAAGKVEVATAVFEAAYKISELPAGDFMIVQEAAEEGLPTDQGSACDLACDSVKQAMSGFYDMLVETAKKIKESATKDMKLVIAMAKKFGISNNVSNFATAFANPLGKSVENAAGGRVELNDKRFLKGKFSIKLADSYVKGVTSLLLAYGINVTDVFSDPVIAKEIEKKVAKGTPESFKGVAGFLSDGGKLIKIEKITDKDGHYTDSVKGSDIADLAISLYIVIAVSDAVVKTAGNKSAKATAMAGINALCEKEDCGDKKVSKSIVAIGDDITKWKDSVEAITTAITKTYTDSIYTLYETITKSSAASADAE